ncbi:MAG: DUF302 domain-containing protein [Armatimonadetes bacterium]|nr:DUF302 domain-containing protein [Armatimonadota bacterium]MDE2205694.1 DUF302 domain-containing protein [Armatimonadota bacterium]
MDALDYTVPTDRGFDDAVASVERAAAANGFRVLHTHDFAATLAEKGFPREPLTVVEICNAKYASEVLAKDVRLALMLPCPISIYAENGRTHIGTMLPSALTSLFPRAGIEETAQAVEAAVIRIVEEAR